MSWQLVNPFWTSAIDLENLYIVSVKIMLRAPPTQSLMHKLLKKNKPIHNNNEERIDIFFFAK